MNNSKEDIPEANAIGQTAFCVHVDWNTLNSYLDKDLPVPDELLERLRENILFVESQVGIWGTDAIERRSKEVVLGTPSWDHLKELFSSYHARFD